MRIPEYIVIVVAVLVHSTICSANDRLDKAWKELSRGRYEEAAQLYQAELAIQPLGEGFNNLGICLERVGRFSEAVRAYQQAAEMPGTPEGVHGNVRRAHIRLAIARTMPYCVGILGLLALRPLSVLASLWRRRRFLAGIRLAEPVVQSCLKDRSVSKDLFVWEETDTITVDARVSVPRHGPSIAPLMVRLELQGPTGCPRTTLRTSVGPIATDAPRVVFRLDDAANMTTEPGTWRIVLRLETTGRILCRLSVPVVTRSLLAADLELCELTLLIQQANVWLPTKAVLESRKPAVLQVVVRPRTYSSRWYTDVGVAAGLVREDTIDFLSVPATPLEPYQDSVLRGFIRIPVDEPPLDEAGAGWRVTASILGREMGALPFTVASPEILNDSITLRDFAMVAEGADNRKTTVGSSLSLARMHAVVPVLTLGTEFTCPVPISVSVAMLVDGEPVAEIEQKTVMDTGIRDICPGEFILPSPGPQGWYRCSLIASVAGRCLGIREVDVRAGLASRERAVSSEKG